MNTATGQYNRIFLLSHMRAYTSLIGHILGSNPAINGYYEMHLSYDDPSTLDTQIAEYRRHDQIKRDSCYFFDKLLHNDYRPLPRARSPVSVKMLVSLREPEATIDSIIRLFSHKRQPGTYASPEGATGYYIKRLEWLANFCRVTDHDYCYFDAGLITRSPDILLPALSHWLELAIPLSAEYQLFSQTGEKRKGDSSKTIYSGTIDTAHHDRTAMDLSEELLAQANSAYRQCRQTVATHAAKTHTL
jgi:hypothetical protein